MVCRLPWCGSGVLSQLTVWNSGISSVKDYSIWDGNSIWDYSNWDANFSEEKLFTMIALNFCGIFPSRCEYLSIYT